MHFLSKEYVKKKLKYFTWQSLYAAWMLALKQYLKPICYWCRNSLRIIKKLRYLPLSVLHLYMQCSTKTAVRDLIRIHWLSSSISCRNPCTVPEFKSVHEYGTVQLEFPYGKAACHSERQHKLWPSQAWNTKFRDYDKSGSPSSLTAIWGYRRMTC